MRRCNLHFTKRGSKGITYVCAVKRKHRYSDTVFSASLQALIGFVESHPEITQVKLLEEYFAETGVEATEDAKKQLLQDLRWLVSEGYVTEYADDRLYADKALPMTQAEDKQRQTGNRKPDESSGPDGGQKPEDSVSEPESGSVSVQVIESSDTDASAADERPESSADAPSLEPVPDAESEKEVGEVASKDPEVVEDATSSEEQTGEDAGTEPKS